MPLKRNIPLILPTGELHPLLTDQLPSSDCEEMKLLDRRALQSESDFYRAAEARDHRADLGSLHIDGHAFTLELILGPGLCLRTWRRRRTRQARQHVQLTPDARHCAAEGEGESSAKIERQNE